MPTIHKNQESFFHSKGMKISEIFLQSINHQLDEHHEVIQRPILILLGIFVSFLPVPKKPNSGDIIKADFLLMLKVGDVKHVKEKDKSKLKCNLCLMSI